MKLYFKPILLANGDWSGESSGEGEFRRRRVIANPFINSDASPLEINSGSGLDLQSIDLPVSDGAEAVPSPEFAPVIEMKPIIDFVAPSDSGN